VSNFLNLFRRHKKDKCVVLMYHHIAALRSDVWDIAVSPENFDTQLAVLKKLGNVISLGQMVAMLQNNTLPHDSVAITFDDGYLDNFTNAAPLLKKYDLPATFFVTSGQHSNSGFFWWDELEYIFLFAEHLPQYFEMMINDTLIKSDLQTESSATESLTHLHEKWNACEQPPPTERAKLFYKVWETLKPLSTTQQSVYLQRITTWSNNVLPGDSPYKIMTNEQCISLSKDELFTIGSHTQTHIALGFHDYETQKKEIAGNRNDLESVINKNVDLLAYPYGNYNHITQKISAECGFKAAFTTEPLPAVNFNEPYRLGRFKVENHNGKVFKRKLNEWLSQ
jgi:peptidoglycan/xylan/chitin deacetylase (PgdA/CDA1 family)